jgi:hypothetical protein
MTMKVMHTDTLTVYMQVIWFDSERCLVQIHGFPQGCDARTAPVISQGLYVPRRGVEGGVAWSIDVLPKVESLVEAESL